MVTRIIVCIFALCITHPAAGEIEIVSASIPPYTYVELEKPQGLIVGIVKAMAKHAGHSGNITFLPWKRALQAAETPPLGTSRLIIPLNRSPEREERFQWVQELYRDQTSLVSKRKATVETKGLTVEQAQNLKVGVLLGSPLEAQLKSLGFKGVEPAVNEETNARKLEFGRIDVWHVARLVAPFVFERNGFDPKNLVYGASLDVNDLYLGASKNLPEDEAKKWQAAFKAISNDGTLKALIKKYSY